VQLVSKILKLCGPYPPTLQTDARTDRQRDRETDGMQSQYRALYYSASRGKNMQVIFKSRVTCMRGCVW